MKLTSLYQYLNYYLLYQLKYLIMLVKPKRSVILETLEATGGGGLKSPLTTP